jgi:hypothetical protein
VLHEPDRHVRGARAAGRPRRPRARTGAGADIELEADGRTRRFDNFDDMTEAALGQSLPLAAMFDWLAGRPWPHSAGDLRADRGAFEQLGWRVDRSRFDSDGQVAADRPLPPPALHVRVKLDRSDACGRSAGASSPATALSASAPAGAAEPRCADSLSTCPAPAKLNLFLHIDGRRADGYHLLQSIFVLIDWADTLHLERRADGRLRRHDLGPALPADDLACAPPARCRPRADARWGPTSP